MHNLRSSIILLDVRPIHGHDNPPDKIVAISIALDGFSGDSLLRMVDKVTEDCQRDSLMQSIVYSVPDTVGTLAWTQKGLDLFDELIGEILTENGHCQTRLPDGHRGLPGMTVPEVYFWDMHVSPTTIRFHFSENHHSPIFHATAPLPTALLTEHKALSTR